MFVGDPQRINLSTSLFENIIGDGCLYVDKSRLIEHFFQESSDVQLIARQRRLGKSLNMDMLWCFLTDGQDYRSLFKGLYIEGSSVWEKAHSAPAFLFDFKNLTSVDYRKQIRYMIDSYAFAYLNEPKCPAYLAKAFSEWEGQGGNPDGLKLLTELVYMVTGKKSYILMDEYDKLLMDNAGTEKYIEIRNYMTQFLSAGLKGNRYLNKALLTGVTRISYEGLLSGLNNMVIFDAFEDLLYVDDYGLTETEARELAEAAGFDINEARRWYNGIKINGHAIYNTYGIMSLLRNKRFDCYWGNTGMMKLIADIMNTEQKRVLVNLLNPGVTQKVNIENRISPDQLYKNSPDEMFFSLLVQAGYLSLEHWDMGKGVVAIPNAELTEVWRRFLLSDFFRKTGNISNVLVNMYAPEAFAADMEKFITPIMEALSYYDLPKMICSDGKARTPEIHYHLLLSGILYAYKQDLNYTAIRSNRESGDGRYDIMLEFNDKVIVFEIKSAAENENIENVANDALDQIIRKRYGADMEKPVFKIGCAFSGKKCKMVANRVL